MPLDFQRFGEAGATIQVSYKITASDRDFIFTFTPVSCVESIWCRAGALSLNFDTDTLLWLLSYYISRNKEKKDVLHFSARGTNDTDDEYGPIFVALDWAFGLIWSCRVWYCIYTAEKRSPRNRTSLAPTISSILIYRCSEFRVGRHCRHGRCPEHL